jgi:hypothetical protein
MWTSVSEERKCPLFYLNGEKILYAFITLLSIGNQKYSNAINSIRIIDKLSE